MIKCAFKRDLKYVVSLKLSVFVTEGFRCVGFNKAAVLVKWENGSNEFNANCKYQVCLLKSFNRFSCSTDFYFVELGRTLIILTFTRKAGTEKVQSVSPGPVIKFFWVGPNRAWKMLSLSHRNSSIFSMNFSLMSKRELN